MEREAYLRVIKRCSEVLTYILDMNDWLNKTNPEQFLYKARKNIYNNLWKEVVENVWEINRE